MARNFGHVSGGHVVSLLGVVVSRSGEDKSVLLVVYCDRTKSLYLNGCDRIREDCLVGFAGTCRWISRLRGGNSSLNCSVGVSLGRGSVGVSTSNGASMAKNKSPIFLGL